MPRVLRALPLMAALIAAPALGAPADEHAAHQPDAPAASAAPKTDTKVSSLGCPGATGARGANSQAMSEHMKDHMAGGQMMGGGQAIGSGMMAGGQNTNCPHVGKPAADTKK